MEDLTRRVSQTEDKEEALAVQLAGLQTMIEVKFTAFEQRLEDNLAALNRRLDSEFLSQLRDHGKRIRELETKVEAIQKTCAAERGRKDGGRAMLAAIFTVASSAGAILGTFLTKFMGV